MRAALPANEDARLAALRAQDILDSPQERSFDDIVQLAQLICDVPIALVTLVDENGTADPLIVQDTNDDPRFADNPLVTSGPNIRSYAGIPIYVDDGAAAVGTLCVIDRVPRQLTVAQLAGLTALARRVEVELRLRKRAITTRNEVRPGSDDPSRPSPRTKESTLQEGDAVGGRYRIEKLIGAGGMGRVYRALDTKTDDRVALKVMGAMAVSSEESVERFVREARSLMKVKNEHVARFVDAGNLDDGAPFLVMEYFEGHDLAHERTPMNAAHAIGLALEACDGVAAVHEAGIIHRDLKPSNLFLAQSGTVTTLKLLDFGISKLVAADAAGPRPEPDSALTQVTTMLGSPRYMSPEQLLSSRDVDASTDIWALGIILYELLTSGHPYDGTSVTEICASIFLKAPRSMRESQPEISIALDEVVLRCMAREPASRWPSARALAEALASVR